MLTILVVVALYDRVPTFVMILGIPYFPFELVLGAWLIVKGFNSSAIAPEAVRTIINDD